MWQILVPVGSGRGAHNAADIGSSGEWEGCTQFGRYWFQWGVGGVHTLWQILVPIWSGRGAHNVADIGSSGEWKECMQCGRYWF